MALYCVFKYSQMDDERGIFRLKTQVISAKLYTY